jgi:hypothetical protein
MNEEIIAYRIGESLFCPDCYKKGAKTLKAVQNAEDPQVTIPAKPITREDISIFACNQCGVVKRSVEKRSNISTGEKSVRVSSFPKQLIEPRRKTLSKREEINLVTLEDILVDSGNKLSFVSDFLVPRSCDDFPEFSDDGLSGLLIILDEVKDDIDFVLNEISERKQKGLIIEKAE